MEARIIRFAALFLWAASGCAAAVETGEHECRPLETRCSENMIMVCHADVDALRVGRTLYVLEAAAACDDDPDVSARCVERVLADRVEAECVFPGEEQSESPPEEASR